MDLSRLQALLDCASGLTLACVGDVMVDRYVVGEVTRVSPEAPIPVLNRWGESATLGAAGNVARNVSALGARAILAGVVGDDPDGVEARRLVVQDRAIVDALAGEPGRRTTVKTRYVSAGQQLLRVDSEDDGALDASTEAALAASVAQAAAQAVGSSGVGAILVSDYAKGAVTPAVLAACRTTAHVSGRIPVIVDPKGGFARYGPVALIKPNARELAAATGMASETDAEVEVALAAALGACEAGAILVTRAGRGMSLIARDGGPAVRHGGPAVRHFRARARAVFDVTGAGDTTLAALGLALAAGAPLGEAVELALLASGVAVGKAGAAVVTPADLVEAELAGKLAPAEAKIAGLDRAAQAASRWRGQGLKVGFTNGCFDILHRGHIAYLDQARGWCDRLIVGLNSDASVRGLKGDGRPVNALESRALVLAGLGCVDLVTPFDAPTPLDLIEAIRPDVLVKGADYTVAEVVGGDIVQAYGGEVRLADLVEGYSTTAAIARLLEPRA